MRTVPRAIARQQDRSAAQRLPADLLALLALAALTVAAAWDVLRPGPTTVGLDAVAFFYPMFSFLGERLAAGDIPGWNPYQFAGAPFAANPESGWTYLPAMLCFALLPLALAAKAFALLHLALAGGGAYALGRVLGFGPVGALTAAAAFAFSGLFSDRLRCCFAHIQVVAWLPALLLGVELALRSSTLAGRLGWWSISGLALSQVLAAWLGQGAYYALLLLGGYVLYRTVIDPPLGLGRTGSWRGALRSRLGALALHGGAVLLIGFGLATAGLVPRLAYHARSNLAEGYTGNLAWAAVLPGWPWRHAAELALGPTGWYVGGAVAALAVVAPLVARSRHATPFFAAVAFAGYLLTMEWTTPLHLALYTLLPEFEALHRHSPPRVLGIVSLAPAMLAGATVEAVRRCSGRSLRRAAVAALPVALALGLAVADVPIPTPARITIPAACLGLAAGALLPSRLARPIPALLVLLIVVDLVVGARRNVDNGLFTTADLAVYDDASGAAAFLRALPEEPPWRFFGYDPALRSVGGGGTMLYRHEYRDPRTTALLVNNRATLLRLPDLQGYDPIQPQRYVEFLDALNGHPQEYHGAYVFPRGLASPLLDLLNARYVVLPASFPPERVDLAGLVRDHPTRFADGEALVIERPTALPRAWIVHEARRVEAGGALPLLAAGAVDPRRTALLETEPPPLEPPDDPAADAVVFEAYEPDRLRLRTRTDAPGLLVLSDGYDPGWTAEVAGEPAPVLVADHALRAVPLPPGEHTVELRYTPPGLRLGLAITGTTAAGLIGALGLVARRRLRERPVGRSGAEPSAPVRSPGGRPRGAVRSGPPRPPPDPTAR